MLKIIISLRVIRASAFVSLQDFIALFSVRLYIIAWVPRILSQIAFYTLFAVFAGGPGYLEFALLGNAVQLMNMTAVSWVAASVTFEQKYGTLPFVITSPSAAITVLSGRNVAMGMHGLLTGLVGLIAVIPFIRSSVTPLMGLLSILILILIGLSCYALGLVMGGIALINRSFSSVVAGLITGIMLSICGINVPVDLLPTWLKPISYSLPLTNGLLALRGVFNGEGSIVIIPLLIREGIILIFYFTIAIALFHRLLSKSRSSGNLELY